MAADQLPPQMELDQVSLGTFATLWLTLAVRIIASAASAGALVESNFIFARQNQISSV